MTRFCYLKVDNESLRIYSVGREIKYPYEDILKVNFDFAREQALRMLWRYWIKTITIASII